MSEVDFVDGKAERATLYLLLRLWWTLFCPEIVAEDTTAHTVPVGLVRLMATLTTYAIVVKKEEKQKQFWVLQS